MTIKCDDCEFYKVENHKLICVRHNRSFDNAYQLKTLSDDCEDFVRCFDE